DLRSEQVQLVAQMDERLENALAEAAALEAIDEQAAKELAARELALRESEKVAKLASTTASKQPKVTNVVAKTPNSSTSSSSGAQSSPTTTKPKATTTTKPKATTTTKPKSSATTTTSTPSTPSGIVTWAEIVYVGGIPVHKSVASQVSGLLNAATAAGFSLSGGGYRDSQSQIETRKANCGTTYYDIYEKPSSQCTPPTAIPGRSMHERGLAMDLKSGGFLITSRSNPAFIWLSANASRFGFYNLPSEPWHWSTNGR
ncbi:MAG: M15 family metallopeptidase, partial [Microthrixaceae bacterium]|nr:M15 family metallopeptidase [Microthrixaceae bacterium]